MLRNAYDTRPAANTPTWISTSGGSGLNTSWMEGKCPTRCLVKETELLIPDAHMAAIAMERG
jgi:hypothetical protein